MEEKGLRGESVEMCTNWKWKW